MSDGTREARTARQDFRVLTQTRGGYGDGVMYDVQLQSAETGALAWAQTFTHADQADEFRTQVEDDLDMASDDFRRKYGVTSST